MKILETSRSQILLGALYKLRLGMIDPDNYIETERYLLRDIWFDKVKHLELSGEYTVWGSYYKSAKCLSHLRAALLLHKHGFSYYRNAIQEGLFQ